MIKIEMNEDISEKKKIGMREVISIALIAILMLVGSLASDATGGLSTTLVVPVVCLIGVLGFYSRDGMSMMEIFHRRAILKKAILYCSTEEPDQQMIPVPEKENKKRKNKKKEKIKKG